MKKIALAIGLVFFLFSCSSTQKMEEKIAFANEKVSTTKRGTPEHEVAVQEYKKILGSKKRTENKKWDRKQARLASEQKK